MGSPSYGFDTIILRENNLQSAVYFYTLFIDGKRIDTKRMVVE